MPPCALRATLASIFAALAFAAGAARADDGEDLSRLSLALAALAQERQALYEQFQMIESLRRDSERRALYATQMLLPQHAAGVADYADVIAAQREAARRADELAHEADALYARYAELAARATQLRQRLLLR